MPHPDDTSRATDRPTPAEESASTPGERPVLLRVRRSPRYPVFAAGGAALGFMLGVLLARFGPATTTDPDTARLAAENVYGAGASMGFLGVLGALIGLFLGLVVALLLDRRR